MTKSQADTLHDPNRYAPPQSRVGDVDATVAYQAVRLWSASGRIGRIRLIGYSAGANLVCEFIWIVASGLLKTAHAPVWSLILAMLLVWVPYGVLATLLSIQRAHDIGWSGWACLISLIPGAGLIFLIKAGTPGRNEYGDPPPPNTTRVRILALLGTLLIVVGIAAAIAIPAYQHYLERARAAGAR